MKKVIFTAGLAGLALLMILFGGWGVLALVFSNAGKEAIHDTAAGSFGVLTIVAVTAFFVPLWRRPVWAAFALSGAVLLAWWSSVLPSNDRDWQDDVSVLSDASVDGDLVTVHNIRNFDYRSETDFTPRYYDKTFDLTKLEGVDLVSVYWMGPAIAHVFVSFAFAGDQHLAVSIETRKEKGEQYSTLKGFFRQYELYYVVADERDVIRLRTNYRRDPPEDVYVYRLRGDIVNGRQFFRQYMAKLNELEREPQFYNTLTTNCTTTIWANSRINPEHPSLNWKILASGYVPEFLYETDRLANDGLSFAALQEQVHVNARAHLYNDAPDFSARIRAPVALGAMAPTNRIK